MFETFKKWKFEVENQTGLKVKCLRSDNGGEYDKSEFKAFYAAEGIRLMIKIHGKARQNGIAERMNRTLNERARSMRIHCGLPKTFSAAAVSAAAYLLDQQGTISSFRVQYSRGGVDRKRTPVLTLEEFWLHCLCSC